MKQNISFKRKLKQLLKNLQRCGQCEEDKIPLFHAFMKETGWYMNSEYHARHLLRPQLKGKALARIGRVALKNKMLVHPFDVRVPYNNLHKIPFFCFRTETVLYSRTETLKVVMSSDGTIKSDRVSLGNYEKI